MASFLVGLTLLFSFVCGNDDQDALYDMISTRRQLNTLPQEDPTIPVLVNVALSLQRIISLDVDSQEMVADGILSMRWNDFRLTWSSFENVDHIVWPTLQNIWTPDIVVVDGFGSQFDNSPETSSLRIDHLGNVTLFRRLRMRVPCNVSPIDYVDSISCAASLSSWAHDSSSLRLVPADGGVDLSRYWEDSRYVVTEAGVIKSNTSFDCCAAPFDVIKYILIISQ